VAFRDKLFGARLYVLAFAICLIAPAALLSITRPEFDGPRSTARLAINFATFVLLDTACLVAALGIKPRVVRWLAAMVLSAGVLRYGYMELGMGRNWSVEVLLFLVMSFPFFGGPLCVGIWLCFPRFHPRRNQPGPDCQRPA
jgi:hypothetical protein